MKKQIPWLAFAACAALAAIVVLLGVPHDPSTGHMIVAAAAAAAAAPVTEADLKAAVDAFAKSTEEVKAFAEQAQAEMKKQGELTAELKANVDKAITENVGLIGRIGDVEQKLARRAGGSNPILASTPGAKFVAAAKDFNNMKPGARGSWRVDVMRSELAMMADITSGSGSAGSAVIPDYRPGIVELPRRPLRIRSLLSQGRTNSNAYKYVKELVFTNNAGVVSEGTGKPKSDITYEIVTGNVATIAHYMKSSNQILADFPALQSAIDNRLRYGVALAEEDEILFGDGTGEHLLGIVPQATAFSAPFTPTDQQDIDTIRLAILQVYLALYPPDGIVLHPTDWAKIELTKDSLGRYLIANPQGIVGKTLWGLPVVDSLAQTAGDFLVGSFQLGAEILDREDAAVEVSSEDGDNFTKNMVTIRGEERMALPVYRPASFVTGSF